MVDHSLLRNGNKVLVDNQPYVIMDTDFVNPGKGQAFTKIKIKNLLIRKLLKRLLKLAKNSMKQMFLTLQCNFSIKNQTLYFL
jgi:elongation factor P